MKGSFYSNNAFVSRTNHTQEWGLKEKLMTRKKGFSQCFIVLSEQCFCS
jgi:hypothetical protein